jgi:hypothetical protein
MFLFTFNAPLCAIFISLFVTSMECVGAVAYSQSFLPPCNDRPQLAQLGFNYVMAGGSGCRFCPAVTFRARTSPSLCSAEGSCWCCFVASSKCTPWAQLAEKLFYAPNDAKCFTPFDYHTCTKWPFLSPKGADSDYGPIEDEEVATHDAEKWIAQQPPPVCGLFSKFLKHPQPSFAIHRHAEKSKETVFGWRSSRCSQITSSDAACRAAVQADGNVFSPCHGRSASLFRRAVNAVEVCLPAVGGYASLSLATPVSVAAEKHFLRQLVMFHSDSTLFSFWSAADWKLDFDLQTSQNFGTNLILNSSCYSASQHASESNILIPCIYVESKNDACMSMPSSSSAIDENVTSREFFEMLQSAYSESVAFPSDFLEYVPSKRKLRCERKDRHRSVIACYQSTQFTNLIGAVYSASFSLKLSSVTRHLVHRCSASSSRSSSKFSRSTRTASLDGRGFYDLPVDADVFTCSILLALSVVFGKLLKAVTVGRASLPISPTVISSLLHPLGHELFSFLSVAAKFYLGYSSKLQAFLSLWFLIILRSLWHLFGSIPIYRLKLAQPHSQRQITLAAFLLCISISSLCVDGQTSVGTS